MKRLHTLLLFFLSLGIGSSQEIYIINNENQLKILEISNFTVADVLTVDQNTFGTLLDIAFNPDGRLFATTSFNKIIEIDLSTQQAAVVFDLPAGATYPGLGANANNELVTSKFLQLELYAYNLDTQEFNLVENDISTPGDFTYFKGNLVYPSFFNDFIKAYDGTSITNVGCSVPLIFGFTNVFEDCQTNTIYAFDEDAKVYEYTLGAEDFAQVADLWTVTGPIFGAATLTEYMASACTLESIDEVECTVLSANDYNPFGIELLLNPVDENIRLQIAKPVTSLRYALINIQGMVVKQGELRENEIPAADLSSGWYLLQLRDERGRKVFTEKLIKN